MGTKMTALTNHDIQIGEKNCILCNKDFEYIAIICGRPNVEELLKRDHPMSIADQVVILNKVYANHHHLKIIDIEITARCPHCQCSNRFTSYVTLENNQK
ncbi:hypothetical protein FAY30_09990 [Bacillus sp. S3]|uniref:hypothetical protein n=1 Tax=Bacillus sp. S3 TaxID=486398 RepID=UPI00118CB692|nr:hypothetical protein [Bacillus sp. S3]QCJ42208.1 hypothetical protein FAY30_09990 [Bacillus sp. S3]